MKINLSDRKNPLVSDEQTSSRYFLLSGISEQVFLSGGATDTHFLDFQSKELSLPKYINKQNQVINLLSC